jgi:D-alanyl-lipoteichoic acid acyltransferase DltB (MBOAT superfamily)
MDYVASLQIFKTDKKSIKNFWLVTCIIVDFGMLAYFKYTNFALDSVYSLLSQMGITQGNFIPFNIILPIGISFHTFQSISYTIDVYRKQQVPIRNYINFVNYVMLWPQMVAGPILRASEIIPQFFETKYFRLEQFKYGLERILYGTFKKAILADSIAPWVDTGFSSNAHLLSTLDCWTLAFGFGFQIYFDFSGYSDIAIGSAHLLGIKFPENFNFPYFSTSPREFWKRWHISLSSWIRDYLYLPLMGQCFRAGPSSSTGGLEIEQKKTNKQRSVALFLTWAIMGLWHGANWTFVAWGLWLAGSIYLFRKTSPLTKTFPPRLTKSLGWLWTLCIAMSGWVFFRSDTLGRACTMLQSMFLPWKFHFSFGQRESFYLITGAYMLGMCLTYVFVSLKIRSRWKNGYIVGKIALFSLMVAYIILEFKPIRQFIYFQF